MKRFFILYFALIISVFSAAIPQSIMLESGDLKVRLDGRKRWNMNRIEYQGELLSVDSPNAHYGMTCRPIDFKYAVGSGHEETGFGEKVVSLKIFSDGKEIVPQENISVCGSKIKVEKGSKILDLNVKYDILIENNIISEFIEVCAEKDMKLHHLYFFMHPWSPRFTDLHISNGKKSISNVVFKSDNGFVNRKFVPYGAWYDKKTGHGAATVFKNIRGGKKLMRFIWDRPQYRKDYLCDFFKLDFPAGHVVSYEAKTTFFRQNDNSKWISDAEEIFKKIKL